MRRSLIEDGAAGWQPAWYPLMRAAKYLGVAPWDLLDKPLFWQRKALLAENAEIEAANERQRRQEATSS